MDVDVNKHFEREPSQLFKRLTVDLYHLFCSCNLLAQSITLMLCTTQIYYYYYWLSIIMRSQYESLKLHCILRGLSSAVSDRREKSTSFSSLNVLSILFQDINTNKSCIMLNYHWWGAWTQICVFLLFDRPRNRSDSYCLWDCPSPSAKYDQAWLMPYQPLHTGTGQSTGLISSHS